MPAIKYKPSPAAQKRDFWGDADRGRLFLKQIEQKFGTEFGSRKTALSALHLQRRLFNMYITGERSIPDEIWSLLRSQPKYAPPSKKTKLKRAKRNAEPSSPALYIDDIDPLS